MILTTIGLMCLLELKKEQHEKNRKNSAEKLFLIKMCFIDLCKRHQQSL